MVDNADTPSDLATIARLNGDFRRNYGPLLGAFLYLRSISAARGRSTLWAAVVSLAGSTLGAWLLKRWLGQG
jgi:hypothetical protein